MTRRHLVLCVALVSCAVAAERQADDGPGGSTEARLRWPVPPNRVIRAFGSPTANDEHQLLHQGLDLAVPAGTPVYASEAGTVVYVRFHDRDERGDFQIYGEVAVCSREGRTIRYIHLDRHTILKRPGDEVKVDEKLGEVSEFTDGVTHLHIEIGRLGEGPVGVMTMSRLTDPADVMQETLDAVPPFFDREAFVFYQTVGSKLERVPEPRDTDPIKISSPFEVSIRASDPQDDGAAYLPPNWIGVKITGTTADGSEYKLHEELTLDGPTVQSLSDREAWRSDLYFPTHSIGNPKAGLRLSTVMAGTNRYLPLPIDLPAGRYMIAAAIKDTAGNEVSRSAEFTVR